MTGTVSIITRDVNAQIILETLLRLRGLDVRVATDDVEPCEMLAREGVGVVVVDLSAPLRNGAELLRKLRPQPSVPGCAPTPRIVVLTDHEAPEVERFAERLRADACMRKPLEPRRFIATVEGLLAGKLSTRATGATRS